MADLRARMSNREYAAWGAYHALRAQEQDLEMKKARG